MADQEIIDPRTRDILNWIQEDLKIKLTKPGFRENLDDGVLLCTIANTLKPNSVTNYRSSPRMRVMKLDNISMFLGAAKSQFNVPSSLIFKVEDGLGESRSALDNILNLLLHLRQAATGGELAAGFEPPPDEEAVCEAAAVMCPWNGKRSQLAAHHAACHYIALQHVLSHILGRLETVERLLTQMSH